MNSACVAPLLELLNCLVGVLLPIGKEQDLLSIMLEEMGYDAEANTCAATCDDVDLLGCQRDW